MKRAPFSDFFEREAAYRKAHNLPADSLVFTDQLYTAEERRTAAVQVVADVGAIPEDEASQLLLGFELIPQAPAHNKQSSAASRRGAARTARKGGSHDF